MKFWIDPQSLMSGKYNYGLIQHEGSGRGYSQSTGARRYGAKTPKTGYGIRHDHFMTYAFESGAKWVHDQMMKLPQRVIGMVM